METATTEGDSPVRVRLMIQEGHLSRAGHVESCPNLRGPSRKAKHCGDHPARLNTPGRPIVDQYREGKVGSTPNRGVKQNLKPFVYKRSELLLVRSDGVPFA